MIAAKTQGRGFRGLASYLETGKDGEQAGRVEWRSSRNLPTDEPRLAARMMRATANQNDRVQKPVYHVSLSFAGEDQVNQARMEEAAGRVLDKLGLSDHQAVMVAHNDTEHKHVHLMVNRVHPETGKVWDNSHDYARIEKACREVEREMGLKEVPGHHYQLEGQQRPERFGPSSGELRHKERTGQDVPSAAMVKEIGGDVRKDVAQSRSWDELDARLQARGLSLEAKGGGLILKDGQGREAKASDIDRKASRKSLEARFGSFQQHRQERARRVAKVQEQSERARAMEDAKEQQRNQPRPDRQQPPAQRRQDVERQLNAALDRLDRYDDASMKLADLQSKAKRSAEDVARYKDGQALAIRQEEALKAKLGKVYRDPQRAREALDGLIREKGVAAAMETLDSKPAALGQLKGWRVGPFASQERKAAERAGDGLSKTARDAHVSGREAERQRPLMELSEKQARLDNAASIEAGRAMRQEFGDVYTREQRTMEVAEAAKRTGGWESLEAAGAERGKNYAGDPGVRAAMNGEQRDIGRSQEGHSQDMGR